jgi:hypothetical protein
VHKIKRACRSLPGAVDSAPNGDEIAEAFANTYKNLYRAYSSVQCNADDLNSLWNSIDKRLAEDKLRYDCIVHHNEVADAVNNLKAHKSEGTRGLLSDFIVNASVELHINLALLIYKQQSRAAR